MNNFIISLGTPGSAVAALITYIFSAYFIGRFIIAPEEKSYRHINIIIALVCGIDILAVTGLIAGCSELLNTGLLKILIQISSILGLFLFLKDIFSKKSLVLRFLNKNLLQLLMIIIPASLFLGRALCYPTAWDELTYQLAVPARWLKDNFIAFYPDNPYSGFPSSSNISFLLLYSIGGIITARLFIWFCWVICLISLYILLRPGLSKSIAVALVSSFSLSYAILMAATSTYSEMFILSQFATIMLILKFSCQNHCCIKNAIILGLISGTAASVKLTGLAIPFVVIIYFAFLRNEKRKLINIKFITVYLLSLGLISSLFYIRPWIATGNPFYPYYAEFFNMNSSAVETSRYHYLAGLEKYGSISFTDFFTSPFYLSSVPLFYDGCFGWQFLIIFLTVLVLLIKKLMSPIHSASDLNKLMTISLFFYVFWFFTSQQARFLIPCFFIMILCSKHFFRSLKSYNKTFCLSLLLIMTLISLPVKIFKDAAISWKAATGNMKFLDYIYSSTGDGYLKALDVINSSTSKNSKVMLLFENRGLYVPREYVIGTPFFQEAYFTPPEKIKNPDEILETLKDAGITHVLLGLSLNDPDRLPSYLDRCEKFGAMIGELRDEKKLVPIWEGEGFTVFKVEYNHK